MAVEIYVYIFVMFNTQFNLFRLGTMAGEHWLLLQLKR